MKEKRHYHTAITDYDMQIMDKISVLIGYFFVATVIVASFFHYNFLHEVMK